MRLVLLCLLLPHLLTAADVITGLPASPGIVHDDTGTRWHGLPITGLDANRHVVVRIDGRSIAVARALVAHDDRAAADALPTLCARAVAADIDPATLRLDRGLLTGVHLRGPEILVLPSAILRRVPSTATDNDGRRAAITTATAALLAKLAQSSTSPPVQATVRRLLTTLDQTNVKDEEFRPALVRRLIAEGMLDAALGTFPELATLRDALRAGTELTMVERWTGDNHEFTELRDAFDRRVMTLRSPDGSARLHQHAPSSYDHTPTRMVVQRFPAGSDPLSDALPLAAECWWGRTRIVDWNAADGLRVDRARWRLALADEGPGVGDHTVVDWRPPHLVLDDASGAVTALCLSQGLLRPATSPSSDERERFLADAARLCPDAAHLDLIGQYLFAYVHDSPDPTLPHLIGVNASKGDIHQTVEQTIATVCGGVMRGDCDDLSEVYHALLTRQGHLPHVFNLPRHAACGWSLKNGDQWTTQILHTGQPLAFHGETLEQSLAQAFGHFDQQNTDNGTLVHLLLRFAGENTRSAWRLGSRIMYDAPYARTMIAVQRDWHFHTFAQGIITMRGLIADGDTTSANWSELAGLYRKTGQWREAIAAQRASLKLIDDVMAQIDGRLSLIALLGRDGQHAAAENEARALMDAVTQRFAKEQPAVLLRVLQSIHHVLDPKKTPALSQELLTKHLLPHLETRRPQLAHWARTQFNARAWATQAQEERGQAATLIGAALHALTHRRDDLTHDADLQRLLAFSEGWIEQLAFLDTGDRDDVMSSYAIVGALARKTLGDSAFDQLLLQADEPTTWDTRHQQRTRGFPQLRRDLPWIRISVPYWSARLSEQLGDQTTVDDTAARALIPQLRAALAAYRRLDIDPAGLDHTQRWIAMIEALLNRNEDELRAALRAYAERRDRRSDTMVTANLEAMARHLPPAWFRRVLAVWDETAATKPDYFALAWGYAVRGDIAHALEASALAARRFADDPAFVAEHEYLQQVLAGGAKP